MENIAVEAIPVEYELAVDSKLQGEINEVSYSVSNYIDQSRKLVTDQDISFQETGRETVSGEPISKKCIVYLPAGYDQSDEKTKYNVLYLLHGVGGNRYEWLRGSGEVDSNYVIANILDNLFTYVGAFSNAPTSSEGNLLGSNIASSEYSTDLLYMTCGDEDWIALENGYQTSVDGLVENAGDKLVNYYQVLINGGGHDFKVWNNGSYNNSSN